MFSIGWGELLVILILFVVLVGPQQMPTLAYKVGRMLGMVRRLGLQVQQNVEQAALSAEAEARNKAILAQETKNKEQQDDLPPA